MTIPELIAWLRQEATTCEELARINARMARARSEPGYWSKRSRNFTAAAEALERRGEGIAR